MDSNFVPEALPNFLDLRIRIINSVGRLNAYLTQGVEVRGIATILAHQGSLLLRLEETWAGMNLVDAPNLTHYPKREAVLTKAA